MKRPAESARLAPYHQVIVTKAEFANSMIKEQYQTLRRWVLAQRIAKADFAITFHCHYSRLSFREMNSTIQNAILFLKMNGVIGIKNTAISPSSMRADWKDLRGYKASAPALIVSAHSSAAARAVSVILGMLYAT